MEKSEINEEEKLQEQKVEKIMKTEEIVKEKKHNKIVKYSIIIGAICIVLLLISTIFALININNNNIVSGVTIEGIDVSGLSKDNAKEKLQVIYDEQKNKEIILKYEEYEKTVTPELIETNYQIEEAIEEAEKIGKDGNIFVNNYNILLALMGKKNVEINVTKNEEIEKQTIDSISAELPGAREEADYYVEEDELVITKGKEGAVIKPDELSEKIYESIKDINSKQDYIDIPVEIQDPEAIDIEKIHEEVYKEVQDAYYIKDPFEIHAEVVGIDFDVEVARQMIESEEKEEYTIKLTITNPKVTISDIGSEIFPDLLATFTTRYDASQTDRTTNLRLACEKINNKIVLPDETFSYNKTLGVRSTATGYKNAKVYENGEVVDGIGGGICQISSPLYNAVVMANLEIVERRNHQFITSYVTAGRDATVVYGATDFKFKNTRKYPVKIKASVSNGIATVSVYGIKEETEYSISFETRTISTIPYTIKYEEDATLSVGTETVKQKGANGAITETYKVKKLNGAVVSRELLSKDTYNAMQRIIITGTGGSSSTSITSNNSEMPSDSSSIVPTESQTEIIQSTETVTEEETSSETSESEETSTTE